MTKIEVLKWLRRATAPIKSIELLFMIWNTHTTFLQAACLNTLG